MTSTEPIPDFPFAQPDPLEPPREWAELREKCPVTRARTPAGDEVGLVCGYDDSRAVLHDPRFSSDLSKPGGARLATTADGGLFNRGTTPGADIREGAGHRRWRRLLAPSFTVKKMEAWRPTIQRITDALLDEIQANGSPSDIMADLAHPLTVQMICALVGASPEDGDKLARWCEISLTLTRFGEDEVDQAWREFGKYASDLIEQKRADPGPDLVSELARISDVDDGQLNHMELIMTVITLLIAGFETTVNMIGKMMAMVLAERERFEAVVGDPELVPGTVEEVLRLDTNLFPTPRLITRDIEVGGTPVPAGTTVLVMRQAANRDERKFAEAARFDPRRENSGDHLSFGAGPYVCIGRALARAELQVVLGTLAHRLPTLRLRDSHTQLRRRPGIIVGGFESVWVTW